MSGCCNILLAVGEVVCNECNDAKVSKFINKNRVRNEVKCFAYIQKSCNSRLFTVKGCIYILDKMV